MLDNYNEMYKNKLTTACNRERISQQHHINHNQRTMTTTEQKRKQRLFTLNADNCQCIIDLHRMVIIKASIQSPFLVTMFFTNSVALSLSCDTLQEASRLNNQLVEALAEYRDQPTVSRTITMPQVLHTPLTKPYDTDDA